jgi:hypothetical protein
MAHTAGPNHGLATPGPCNWLSAPSRDWRLSRMWPLEVRGHVRVVSCAERNWTFDQVVRWFRPTGDDEADSLSLKN